MKIRRRLTGVLSNFLMTYSSRYSDLDGYWLFGLLFPEMESPFSIDLLGDESESSYSRVRAAAGRFARIDFKEQLQKNHIPIQFIREAKLQIVKLNILRTGPVNGRIRPGCHMSLIAQALSDAGKGYRFEHVIFVAPHDPNIEQRSGRRNA